MKNSKLIIAMLAIVAGAFTSCKKKKVETPAPVSNVHSFTYSTTNSAWSQNNNVFSAILTVEDINEDILSKGSVNVFIGDGTGYNWTAMPVTLNQMELRYSMYLHTVQVSAEWNKNDNSAWSNPGVQQFKVVVISGAARTTHPDLNWNNYNEIKKEFHLAN